MMTLRRLDPAADRTIYEQVFGWERMYPRWLRDAEKSCGMSLDEFLACGQLEKRADIAVYTPDLTAMVSVNFDRGPGVFEAHIWAVRRTPLALLADAASVIIASAARELRMTTFIVWVAKRNAPIRRLCGMLGCVADATVIDGESHGKPTEWVRMVWRHG
jgi:hypothetical protein